MSIEGRIFSPGDRNDGKLSDQKKQKKNLKKLAKKLKPVKKKAKALKKERKKLKKKLDHTSSELLIQQSGLEERDLRHQLEPQNARMDVALNLFLKQNKALPEVLDVYDE